MISTEIGRGKRDTENYLYDTLSEYYMTDLYSRSFFSWKQAQILFATLLEIGKVTAVIASGGSLFLLLQGWNSLTVMIGFILFILVGSVGGLFILLLLYHSNRWVTRAGMFTIGVGIYFVLYFKI